MKKILCMTMLCAFILSITNCGSKGSNRLPENQVVSDAMTTLNERLPIHLEGLGRVRSVDCEGNNVILYMNIKDEASSGLSVAKITDKPSLAKEIVSAQIGMMDNQLTDALKSIASQSYGVKVLISGSSSSREGEINLTADNIEMAIADSKEMTAEDFSLLMISMTTRLMLPARVDQISTWTDTRMTDDSFEYVYRIDDGNLDFSSVDIEALKREKVAMLGQNTDLLGNVVRGCIATHRNLIFRYIGNSSKKTINVVLTENDLRNI